MSKKAGQRASQGAVLGATIGGFSGGGVFSLATGAVGAGVGFVFGATAGLLEDAGTRSSKHDGKNDKGSPQNTIDTTQKVADEAYRIDIAAQDARVQTDDKAQLDTIGAALKNDSYTLDQKIAAIDAEIKAGLGTDSIQLANKAKVLAIQYYDLHDPAGARAIAKKNLDTQLAGAKSNIDQSLTNRDVGLSGINATNAALGVDGTGATAQVQSGAYSANVSIQDAMRKAGYTLDALTSGGGDISAFDTAVGASLAGDNTYLQQYANEVTKTDLGYKMSLDSFGSDMTNLLAIDTAYRDTATNNNDKAQINTDAMQWQLDQATKDDANWALGLVSGLADGVANVPSYYNAGANMGWWSRGG